MEWLRMAVGSLVTSQGVSYGARRTQHWKQRGSVVCSCSVEAAREAWRGTVLNLPNPSRWGRDSESCLGSGVALLGWG